MSETTMITYFNDPFTEKEGLPKIIIYPKIHLRTKIA